MNLMQRQRHQRARALPELCPTPLALPLHRSCALVRCGGYPPWLRPLHRSELSNPFPNTKTADGCTFATINHRCVGVWSTNGGSSWALQSGATTVLVALLTCIATHAARVAVGLMMTRILSCPPSLSDPGLLRHCAPWSSPSGQPVPGVTSSCSTPTGRFGSGPTRSPDSTVTVVRLGALGPVTVMGQAGCQLEPRVGSHWHDRDGGAAAPSGSAAPTPSRARRPRGPALRRHWHDHGSARPLFATVDVTFVALVTTLVVVGMTAMPGVSGQQSPYKSVVKGTVPEPTIPPGCDYRNVCVGGLPVIV